jgi:ubiquinone/menaquinone biosynthesis C-methylase UbiE
LQANSVDYIFLIFAAHEIRNEAERTSFFKQLKNVLKDDGKIIVTEHQRDLPNFIAYTIGFFHFYTNKTWKKIFTQSALSHSKRIQIKSIRHYIYTYKKWNYILKLLAIYLLCFR